MSVPIASSALALRAKFSEFGVKVFSYSLTLAMGSVEEDSDERPLLLCMFWIATGFSYGPLLCFPLYQALVASKGQSEVDPTTGGLVLMGAKCFTVLSHNVLSNFRTELWGLKLQVLSCLVLSMACLTLASLESVSGIGMLAAVGTLHLTHSAVVVGPLVTVPSEGKSKFRSLFYYVTAPLGCVWTSLVSFCLAQPQFQSSWKLRAIALNSPLLVTLFAWVLVPRKSFWSAARMREAQKELGGAEAQEECPGPGTLHASAASSPRAARARKSKESACGEEAQTPQRSPRAGAKVAFSVLMPEVDAESPGESNGEGQSAKMGKLEPSMTAQFGRSKTGNLRRGRTGKKSGLRSTGRRTTMARMRGTFADRTTLVNHMTNFTPLTPILARELTHIGALDDILRHSRATRRSQQIQAVGSPWADGCFRVLACCQCLNVYGFCFYGFNVFPMLIAETGPSLDAVSMLYTVEGFVQAVLTVVLMPWLDTKMFWKFFLATWVILVSSPLAICFLGRLHWILYPLLLLVVDVALCCATGLLSVLLLRTLPWEYITTFHTQVSTLSGLVAGASFVQMPLRSAVGTWEATSLIGHGTAAFLLLAVYATHLPSMRKFWELLADPVERNADGELEEDEEDIELPEIDEIDEDDATSKDPPNLARVTEQPGRKKTELPGMLS